MKFEIEQYKKQTIEYDDELDKFICEITIEDRSKPSKRGSLKDLRKEIDTFIKENLEFKKFKLFEKKSYSSDFEIIHVDGIRTDGKFTCKSERHGQLSKSYDLVDFEKEIKSGDQFYFYDAEILAEKKEIAKEEEKYRKIISDKEKELLKKLKKFDISNIKHYTDAFAKS